MINSMLSTYLILNHKLLVLKKLETCRLISMLEKYYLSESSSKEITQYFYMLGSIKY